jgi:RNA polymerase sigma-70 factor (ECF subfamily)
MESEAFERRVLEHKDRVYSYAAWMLRDLEEARDVAQEALVKLWQHRQKVEIPATRSWLLTTTHRLCIDRLRRRQKRPEVSEEDQLVPTPDEGPGPLRLAASSETGRAISEALGKLGEQDRAVVVMREVQGMAYDEIATALDIPLGTLKAKLHRARERLRRHLTAVGVTP